MIRTLLVSAALLLTMAASPPKVPQALQWQPAHTTAPSRAALTSRSTFRIVSSVVLTSSCYHVRIFAMTPVDPHSPRVYEVQQARPSGMCPQVMEKCDVVSKSLGPPAPSTVDVKSENANEHVNVSGSYTKPAKPCGNTDK